MRRVALGLLVAVALSGCSDDDPERDGRDASVATSTVSSVPAATSFPVRSCSMAPTLLPGYTVKVGAAARRVERSDIVYFIAPPSVRRGADDLRVSRVVGMPGDRLEARDGKVFIDGAPADEPYLVADTPTLLLAPQTVPPGRYFLMGDNRTNSADSRSYGPVDGADVRYRAIEVIEGDPSPDDIGC